MTKRQTKRQACRTFVALLCAGLLVASVGVARAGELADVDATASPSGIEPAVADGLFLPLTLSGSVGSQRAIVAGMGGYDAARKRTIAGTSADVRLWGPVALRIGAEYVGSKNEARPTVGLRSQLLRQQLHGVDGAVGVFYRPEGFTEPEGEVEAFLSVARRVESVSVAANLVYGQDPEGNERDGEVRLAVQYLRSRWAIGFDSRLRVAIGAQTSPSAMAEPKFDLLAGPVVTAAVGPVALFAEAGPSVLRLSNETFTGVAGVAGVGTVF